MTRIAIIGAAGRMGRALLRAAAEDPTVTVVAAIASNASSAVGRDAGELAGIGTTGLKVTGDLAAVLGKADVAIDFSAAEATHANLAACQNARKPLLLGTTGFTSDLTEAFEAAAQVIPLLVAPNTSIGVTLLIELVRAAASTLPADFDIEIIEAHHRQKRDAPSGTALALGRAAAEGRRQPFDRAESPARTPQDRVGGAGGLDDVGGAARKDGEIGFAAVRGGDIVGDHTVLFAGMGERLALSHQATDRAIFARGALRAAAWLASRPAGRYFMRDLVAYKSAG